MVQINLRSGSSTACCLGFVLLTAYHAQARRRFAWRRMTVMLAKGNAGMCFRQGGDLVGFGGLGPKGTWQVARLSPASRR